MTRPTQHPAPNSTARKAETERRANLTVVPCCDAAAAVARARLEGAVEGWDVGYVSGHRQGCPGACTCGVARNPYRDELRAALDGPTDGGAA